MMLAAVDDRLAAAAVCSGNTENVATVPFFSPGSTDDAEQDLVGSGPLAFDRWDMLWPFAPKPLLIGVSARDFFGTYSPSYADERQRGVCEARARLPAESAEVRRDAAPARPLVFTRVDVYNWFERHLKHSERVIDEEPPTAPEPAETLWCGPDRQYRARLRRQDAVRAAERARPCDSNSRRRARPARPAADGSSRTARRSSKCAARRSIGDCRHSGRRGQHCPEGLGARVAVPPQARLDAAAHRTRTERPQRPLARGRSLSTSSPGRASLSAPRTSAASAISSRSSARAPRATNAPHQTEEDYAWAGLILGRTLLGQRVTDILGVVRAFPQAPADFDCRARQDDRPRVMRRRTGAAHREPLPVAPPGVVAESCRGGDVFAPARELRAERPARDGSPANRAFDCAEARADGRCVGRGGAVAGIAVGTAPRD